jgi:hypothetical protein
MKELTMILNLLEELIEKYLIGAIPKGFSSTKYILQGGFGGKPIADSRIAVHVLADRNALRCAVQSP